MAPGEEGSTRLPGMGGGAAGRAVLAVRVRRRPAAPAGRARGRRAAGAPAGPPAEPVLAQVRDRIADDLDAPGAVAAVDEWADIVLEGTPRRFWVPDAPGMVRNTVDAMLGVAL